MSDRTPEMKSGLKKAKTNTLVRLWAESNCISDKKAESKIREFLLSEFNRRCPEKYNAWINTDEVENIDNPGLFFND